MPVYTTRRRTRFVYRSGSPFGRRLPFSKAAGGSVTVDLSADPALAVWSAVDPTVVLGSITIGLSADPALAAWSAIDPAVILGSQTLDLSGDPALASWSAVDPTVILGAIDLSGDPAIASWSAVDPTVILGSITIDLSADTATAAWSAVDPTVIYGSLTIDLSADPATASWSAVDPTVSIGSGSITYDASGVPATAAWSVPDPVTIRALLSQQVGTDGGYTDVSPKQVVRTWGGRVYIFAVDCASYPCEATGQTIRAYKGDQDGIPSSFTRMDTADEHSGIAGWAVGIDSAGIVHVAWTYRTSVGDTLEGLRYAQYDTVTDQWGSATTIVSGGLTDGVGQGVQTVSLAVDGSDVPHIVYLSGNGTNRRLYYRNRSGGTWSSATQLDTGVSYTGNLRAWHPNIAFDDSGNRVVAWVRGSFNDTDDGTVYSIVYRSGAWQTEVAVSTASAALTSIDQSTSLLVTPDGTYHIAYISTIAVGRYIRYAYSTDDGASWTHNNPGSGTQATHSPSLGLGSVPNTIRIYGHGTPDGSNHGENLYYFQGAGGAATWDAWALIITGANFDSSVSTRWSQYHHYHRGMLDFAYWDDRYPNDLYYGVQDVSIPVDLSSLPAVATWSAVDPTVNTSGVVYDAGAVPAVATWTAVDPTVIQSSMTVNLSADSALASWTAVDPAVILGGIILDLSGNPATAIWSAVDPTVIRGSIAIDLSGDVATAAWTAVDPTLVLSSMTVDIGSLPAIASWSAVDPVVVTGTAAQAGKVEIIYRYGSGVTIYQRPTIVEIIGRPVP